MAQAEKILEYTVIFEPAEEGGYVVSVPSLPGCFTQGNTFEEAYQMAQDAIEGYLEALEKEGQEIPRQPVGLTVSEIRVREPIHA